MIYILQIGYIIFHTLPHIKKFWSPTSSQHHNPNPIPYLGSGNPSSQNDWFRRAVVYFGHILDTTIRIGVSNDRITHFRPNMTRSFNDFFPNPSIVLQPHSPDMIVFLLDLNLETSNLFRFLCRLTRRWLLRLSDGWLSINAWMSDGMWMSRGHIMGVLGDVRWVCVLGDPTPQVIAIDINRLNNRHLLL